MALLLPLYDPVRLAEDFAVLDLASGGPPELGWQSLELYTSKVLPHIRSANR
jgi:hypothetical protein